MFFYIKGFTGVSRAPVLTEKADETCGPNKKVTHHSHLEEAVTVNRKEKTEGGENTGAAVLRILRAALQVRFSSEFTTPFATTCAFKSRVLTAGYEMETGAKLKTSMKALTNKKNERRFDKGRKP